MAKKKTKSESTKKVSSNATVRLSDIRDSINKGLKELGKPTLPEKSAGLKAIADVVEKLFPDVKINRKGLALASVPEDVANEVLKNFAPNTKTVPDDFKEHIYIWAPNTGKIYVPKVPIPTVGLKPDDQWPFMEVFFNPHYHTVDLGSKTYKREYGEDFTMRGCADYILDVDRHAKELTFDEYNEVHKLGGRLPMSKQGVKKDNPSEIEKIVNTDKKTGNKYSGKVFIPED